MKRRIFLTAATAAVAAGAGLVVNPATAASGARPGGDGASGAVYVMTNDADENRVVAYYRAPDGSLAQMGSYETGGRGSGGAVDPLQSQGSLLLDPARRLLFACNAGSGEVSVFRLRSDGRPFLTDKVPTGGAEPVSLALSGDLLYVLNSSSGPGSVVGFRLGRNGRLEPIPGSRRALSANDAGGASLAFRPDGGALVVSERITSRLLTFAIGPDGVPATARPVVTPSPATTPFSLAFAPQGVLVLAAVGGAPDGRATLTSFQPQTDGTLATASGPTPTQGAAACWVGVTPDGRFAYTTNAGSGTITGARIGTGGVLTLLNADGVTARVGAGTIPLDLALTPDGSFLYTLNAGAGTVTGFRVNGDGSLTPAASAAGPAPASGQNGIAAY